MLIKGFEQVIVNLDSLDRNMVFNVSVWVVNWVVVNGVLVVV